MFLFLHELEALPILGNFTYGGDHIKTDNLNIYDIAKEANVSISTVSRVMNNSGSVSKKTRDKVEAIIKKSDYSPNNIARSLASNKSSLIGLLVPDIRNYFHSQACYEIDNLLKDHGYRTLLSNTTKDLDEKIKILKIQKHQMVEGIITVGSDYNEKEFIDEAVELNKTIPIVQLNNYNENLVSVYCDEKNGMDQALAYLKSKNYQKPAFVYITRSKNNRAFNEKKKGYEQALNKYYANNAYIEIFLDDYSYEDLLKKIKSEGIDAIQCENDSIAIKLFKFFTDKGLDVPGDIGIIGFDNQLTTDYTQKRISSIDHKIYDHSKVAVDLLLELINDKEVKRDNVIKPELVVKETT